MPYNSVITPAAEQNATECALLNSRYIFTEREGKRQYGYCTHCQQGHYPDETLKHNSVAMCPHCLSTCVVKSSGRGHSHMIDQTYFVYYDKVPANPDAIVARGIHAVRDYRGDYRHVETKYTVLAYYVFEPGHAAMVRQRDAWYSECSAAFIHEGNWEVAATVYTLPKGFCDFPSGYSRESIAAAVAGTPFRYSTWEEYDLIDMTKFFALAAKYPCVEYLTKLGFSSLIKDRVHGSASYGGINWRGKNVLKVLRMTKQELNEIRHQKIEVDYGFLEALKRAKESGWGLSTQEAISLAADFGPYYFERFKEFLAHDVIAKIPVKKVLSYLDKQYHRDKEHYSSKHAVIITWRDYLEDAKKLRMNLESDSVLFPKSVYNIHQNTLTQLQIKADAKLNEQIARRLEELTKKYFFKRGDLLIRPAKDTIELISEGGALSHCVGRYGGSYARGETVILLVRKIDDPDKPYFTVEVRPGAKEVFQTHGRHNRPPDETVAEFIAAFTEERLAKKVKERIRIPA